jgi:dihydroneopterin aldolase
VDDRIEIRGLRVLGVIGVLPHEQEQAQPFEVDLDIEADLSDAGATDDLDDTINYGEVIERVAALFASEQHELLERVATRIAEEVLAVPGVNAVTVALRKLRPPVPHHVDTTGVRIRREQS